MAKVFYFYRLGDRTPVTNMSNFGITVNATTYNNSNELRFPKDFVGSIRLAGSVTRQSFNEFSANLSVLGLASGGSELGEVRIYPAGIYKFETSGNTFIVGTFLE